MSALCGLLKRKSRKRKTKLLGPANLILHPSGVAWSFVVPPDYIVTVPVPVLVLVPVTPTDTIKFPRPSGAVGGRGCRADADVAFRKENVLGLRCQGLVWIGLDCRWQGLGDVSIKSKRCTVQPVAEVYSSRWGPSGII